MVRGNGPGRLEGRRAMVTGASSGIGEATARLLHREGAAVALIARRGENLEALAGELGEGAVAMAADVADPDAVASALAEVTERIGAPDVAVSCAGVAEPAALGDLDARSWARTIDVNLSGSFYVAREAALRMLDGDGGTIINVGSELSFLGAKFYASYCASKAGVIGLTRALAVELAPRVTVNAVCPGPVDTPMLDYELKHFPRPGMTRERIAGDVPMGRLATPDDVARGILYLAAEAPYATGLALNLDGGTTIT